jgi:hypothetical protein
MKMLKKIIESLFYKDGQFSKTALFLSLATIILLLMWPFQCLFVGVTLFGWWTIPPFSTEAAASVITILSGLYLVNHGWANKSKDKNSDSPGGEEDRSEKM